jgi:hypothetical protein
MDAALASGALVAGHAATHKRVHVLAVLCHFNPCQRVTAPAMKNNVITVTFDLELDCIVSVQLYTFTINITVRLHHHSRTGVISDSLVRHGPTVLPLSRFRLRSNYGRHVPQGSACLPYLRYRCYIIKVDQKVYPFFPIFHIAALLIVAVEDELSFLVQREK